MVPARREKKILTEKIAIYEVPTSWLMNLAVTKIRKTKALIIKVSGTMYFRLRFVIYF
jgi:hypothetical protein